MGVIIFETAIAPFAEMKIEVRPDTWTAAFAIIQMDGAIELRV